MGFNDRTDIESVLEVAGTAQPALPVISPPRTFGSRGHTAFSTPYTDAINALTPSAWWRFNDLSPSAVVVDTQGFANGVQNDPAATLYDQPGLITEHNEFSVGAVNSATSYMLATIPAGVPIADGCTLIWWTRVQPLASFQNAMKLGTDGPSQVIWSCFDGSGAGGALVGATPTAMGGAGTFATTGSNMYAIVYDPEKGNTKFYKNGVLIGSSVAVVSGTRVSSVGFGAGGSGGAKFGGVMDEIALFVGVLGVTTLLSLYNAGVEAIASTTTGVTTSGDLNVGDAVPIGVPSPQGALLSAPPLPVPDPTLATEGPVQGTPAPRIAGKQLVPPDPPPQPAIAGQFSQPANAPQSMLPISTLRQG
jgi:hypothetical protein